ncbi:MAG: hypothetical protein HYT10_00380 [Candidatus Levybacteria bacterium]|nr:hypothetical protein [Candidatus Levybacteria bacterium]
MSDMTKFLLDSGDPKEYEEIARLAKEHGSELWGSTTNPTLIAKKLTGKKVSKGKAFQLQKEIVLEILDIVPGAVSSEVYADESTKAEEMIQQGREISAWHKRVVVKLPTTIEGFIARTQLRKEYIPINNTLVFSQPQIFAIYLHERIIQQTYGPIDNLWPPFISPFVGRLDDISENGMDLVENGLKLLKQFSLELPRLWMLEASVRNINHIKRGIQLHSELITAPAKIYREWFRISKEEREKPVQEAPSLKRIEYWNPSEKIKRIATMENFIGAIREGVLDITHPLTEKGIQRFADDWKAIITT